MFWRTGGAAPTGLMLCQPPLIPPGSTPGAGAVTCGGATCTAPNVCCSGGGGGGLNCSTLTACDNAGNDSYTCTGQANCTGSLCCVRFGQGGTNDISVCQASCAGANTSQVCPTNAECPMSQVCRRGGGSPAGDSICLPPSAMPEFAVPRAARG